MSRRLKPSRDAPHTHTFVGAVASATAEVTQKFTVKFSRTNRGV